MVNEVLIRILQDERKEIKTSKTSYYDLSDDYDEKFERDFIYFDDDEDE